MNFGKKSTDNSYETTSVNKESRKQFQDHKAQQSNELEQFFKKKLDLMYQYPPNLHDAQDHKTASTFGYHPTSDKDEKLTICPCCDLTISNVFLPMSISTTPLTGLSGQGQFFPLDSGTSMFFTFIKMVIIYLSLLFAVSNIYSMHLSYLANDFCKIQPNQCGKSWLINFSPVKFIVIGNANNHSIINALNLIVMVGSIVFFRVFRQYQHHIYGVLDLHSINQDNYTILIKNVPIPINQNFKEGIKNIQYALRQILEEKIKKFINQVKNNLIIYQQHLSLQNMAFAAQIPFQDLQKIKSISLCFKLSELEQILEQRQQLILFNQNGQKNNSQYQQIHSQELISQLNTKYLQLCKKFRSNQQKEFLKSQFIGKAFISFQFQHYRDFILHLYEDNPQEFMIEGQQLKIKKATNPSDIFWLNLNIKRSQRVIKIITSYLLLIGILIVQFVLIIVIYKSAIRPDQQDQDKITIGYTYTLLIAFIIYFTQYILGIIAKILTKRERHQTKTKQTISLIIKIIVTQFLSNAVIYFILNIIQGQHYLLDNGLVVQTSNFIIITGLISLPLNFFQVSNKIQLLFKKLKYCVVNKNKLLQFQYNNIIQLPQFDFADRYCYYLVNNFTLLVYSYVNPICTIFFVIIATSHYWIDKYNLLKCSSSLFPMNFAISRFILKFFQLSIIVLGIGNYYFSIQLSRQFSLVNLIGLFIAVVYCMIAVFSPTFIEQKIFGTSHQIETNSYTKSLSSGLFKQTYWRCNPVTMLIPQPDINKPNQFVNYGFKVKLPQPQKS